MCRRDRPPYAFGYIYLPSLFGIVVVSMFTAPLGARLAQTLPVPKLKKCFALLLIVIGIRMLLKALSTNGTKRRGATPPFLWATPFSCLLYTSFARNAQEVTPADGIRSPGRHGRQSVPEKPASTDSITSKVFGKGGTRAALTVLGKGSLLKKAPFPGEMCIRDRYKSLLVRVAGYSAYFVELSREVQDLSLIHICFAGTISG